MIIHKRGFVKEERILVKKYIEFIYKFILVISILIGICIFVKSRITGNKSEIEDHFQLTQGPSHLPQQVAGVALTAACGKAIQSAADGTDDHADRRKIHHHSHITLCDLCPQPVDKGKCENGTGSK